MTPLADAAAKALAEPATLGALASAAVQVLAALSRPESIAALAIAALIIVLVQKPQK